MMLSLSKGNDERLSREREGNYRLGLGLSKLRREDRWKRLSISAGTLMEGRQERTEERLSSLGYPERTISIRCREDNGSHRFHCVWFSLRLPRPYFIATFLKKPKRRKDTKRQNVTIICVYQLWVCVYESYRIRVINVFSLHAYTISCSTNL